LSFFSSNFLVQSRSMVGTAEVKHTYEHSWKDISIANWKKYPNAERPDVLHVDLLKKEFDPETGILKTMRLSAIRNQLPWWIQKIVGGTPCWYFVEEATIDPKNQTTVLNARNLSFSEYLSLEEICTYTADTKNNWTTFKQEGRVTAFPMGFSSRVEDFCVSRFLQNAATGRKIMENTIQRVKEQAEGIFEEGISGAEGVFASMSPKTTPPENSMNSLD